MFNVYFYSFNHAAKAADTPESCFVFDNPTKTISGYNLSGTTCSEDVVIPSTIGGVAVNTISDGAFASKGLTSVNIPSSVTSIGTGAFQDNMLTSVNIPSSVTSIETAAFMMNRLSYVTIPSSVATIGGSTFAGNQIELVNIEGNPTIGFMAFSIQALTEDGVTFNLSTLVSTVIYAKNMTAPPSSEVLNESDLGFDISGDGDQNDIVSVTIVNPVQLSVSYVDDSGKSVADSAQFTGPGINDYKLASLLAVNPNPVSSNLSEIYYFAGNEIDFSNDRVINGYEPKSTESQSITLDGDSSKNVLTFAYRKTAVQPNSNSNTDIVAPNTGYWAES